MSSIQSHSIEQTGTLFDRLLVYPRIALAVSGGADSTALMLLVHDWREHRRQTDMTYPDIHILTVDHQLREAARQEAEWVCALGQQLGFKTALLCWDKLKLKSGIQDAAREARYDLMTEYCHHHKISSLLTAHHLEDQAETFLMRLARGSGIDGLGAMSSLSRKNGIEIYRPLLSISKQSLIASLQARGQNWFEDPSNENMAYERVRIRKAFSYLAELGISAEALGQSAKRIRRSRKVCEDTARQVFHDQITIHPAGFCSLPLPNLLSAPDDTVLRVLRLALEQTRGFKIKLRLSKLEAVLDQLRALKDHKAITCAGCLIKKQQEQLFIFRETRSSDQLNRIINAGTSLIWDHRFTVHVPDHAQEQAPRPLLLRMVLEDGYQILKEKLGKEQLLALPKEAVLALPSLWKQPTTNGGEERESILVEVPYFSLEKILKK